MRVIFKKNIIGGLFISVLISGCSVLDSSVDAYKVAKNFVFPPGEKVKWKSLNLSLSRDVNDGYPIVIDIVFVKNEVLLNKINDISTTEWFGKKKALVNTFLNDLFVMNWELAPGDNLSVTKSEFEDQRMYGVLLFAKYNNQGDYKVRIDSIKGSVVVDFESSGINAYGIKQN